MVYIYAFLGRLLLYPYLAYRLARLLPGRASRVCNIVLLIELTFAIISLSIHRFIMSDVMSSVMDINLYVFFSIGYTSAFLMGLNGLKFVFGRWVRPLGSFLSLRSRFVLDWVVAVMAVGVFCTVMYIGHRDGHNLKVQTYGEPQEGKKVLARVVLVTDLHIGEGVGFKHIRRVVDSVLALSPDVILIGGDYIDHDSKYAYQPRVMKEMQRLKARDGVYYVPGNHEYRLDSIANFEWVTQVGGTLLIDSIVYPRDSTYAIIGRDDYVHNESRKSLASLLSELKPRKKNILLEHTPEGLDSLLDTPIDYALYGHTHGGQLWPYKYLIGLKYPVPYGYADYGRSKVIVSSGAGAAGTLFRVGTQSEIVFFSLYE